MLVLNIAITSFQKKYCNNLTGVRSANNSDSLPLIDHSNPRKPYHKHISHQKKKKKKRKVICLSHLTINVAKGYPPIFIPNFLKRLSSPLLI